MLYKRTAHLIDEILSVAQEAYPEYTKEQQLSWALGFLATVVLEKNLMDNIIWAKLNERLNIALERTKYKSDPAVIKRSKYP